MKDKDIFDALENASESEIGEIMDKMPELDNDQINRLYKLSEEKYSRAKENGGELGEYQVQVSGVERYKQPVWRRIVYSAAACAAAFVCIAGTVMFLKRGGTEVVPDVVPTSPLTVQEGTMSGESVVTATDAVITHVMIIDETGKISSAAESNGAADAVTTVDPSVTQPSGSGNEDAGQPASEPVTVPPSEAQEAEKLEEYNKMLSMQETAAVRFENLRKMIKIFECPNREYLDMNDTFTITCMAEDHRTGETYDREVTYARMTGFEFSSVAEMKSFLNSNVTYADLYDHQMSESEVYPGCYLARMTVPRYCDYNGSIYYNTTDLEYMNTSDDHVPQLMDSSAIAVREGDESTFYADIEYFSDGMNRTGEFKFVSYGGTWLLETFYDISYEEYQAAAAENKNLSDSIG